MANVLEHNTFLKPSRASLPGLKQSCDQMTISCIFLYIPKCSESRMTHHIPAELIFSNQSETEPARLLSSSLSDNLADMSSRSSASCDCVYEEHSAVLVRLLFPSASLVSIFLAGFGSSAASDDCMRTLQTLSGLLGLVHMLPFVGSKLWEKGAIFWSLPGRESAVPFSRPDKDDFATHSWRN